MLSSSVLRPLCLVPAVLLAVLATHGNAAADPASTPLPHILYINADDLGVMDVGYNAPAFRTPNIDRLATEGMLFTNAYAPAANCAPSRACVHSGRWGARHGVYTVGSSERGRSASRRLIPTKNRSVLPGKMTTLAEALGQAGYQTLHVGKYHLGKDPRKRGFDVNVGGDSSGSPKGGYYSPWDAGSMKPYSERVAAETHRIDVFTEATIEFINRRHQRPMFLHFSPYLVHTPLTPVPEFLGHYQESELNSVYASMVEKLDQAVGRILVALERNGLQESTLVVFSSDNGGIASVNPQHPFRAGKGSYYEGGIREPLVMRWPGRIRPASKCDAVVNTLDLFPTFLDACGRLETNTIPLDGQSLLPLMRESGRWEPRPQFWHFPVYLQAYDGLRDDARDVLFRTRPGSAMRSGKWKLHEYFETGDLELYDLDSDPGERVNLATKMPSQTRQLHQQLIRWREQTGAPVPTKRNPEFDPAAEQKWIDRVMSEKRE